MDVAIIGLVAGLLAFCGAAFGHMVSRRGAIELNTWRKREETFRMLRWATQLALDDQRGAHQLVGLELLITLGESRLLQDEDAEWVYQVITAIARATPDVEGVGWPFDEQESP